MLATLVTLGAAMLGTLYYAYLVAVPFPPDIARVVPFIWLGGAFSGLILGAQAIRANSRRYLAVASVVLSLPNILLAAIFSMAATFGG